MGLPEHSRTLADLGKPGAVATALPLSRSADSPLMRNATIDLRDVIDLTDGADRPIVEPGTGSVLLGLLAEKDAEAPLDEAVALEPAQDRTVDRARRARLVLGTAAIVVGTVLLLTAIGESRSGSGGVATDAETTTSAVRTTGTTATSATPAPVALAPATPTTPTTAATTTTARRPTTTEAPTTLPPVTEPPTTAPTTEAPTTAPPTTAPSTTEPPATTSTTAAPTTTSTTP